MEGYPFDYAIEKIPGTDNDGSRHQGSFLDFDESIGIGYTTVSLVALSFSI